MACQRLWPCLRQVLRVTADATEHLRSAQRAKAAGDFLAHFDHADVLLGLVVGKGHASIPQEGQDVPVEILQPIQQIGRLALRGSALAGGRARVPVTSAPHHVAIAFPGPLELAFVKLSVPLSPPMDDVQQIPQARDQEAEVSLGGRTQHRLQAHQERLRFARPGDSMIGRHIVDGDYVVLEHGPEPRNGDIVAALIDGESTLKTYVLKGGKPYLKAENPKYPDLIPAQELVIQGVFKSLIRPVHI